MLATPEEAKKMFCHKLLNEAQNCYCYGPECFGWRWWWRSIYKEVGSSCLHFEKADRGYCGLAGRPEGE